MAGERRRRCIAKGEGKGGWAIGRLSCGPGEMDGRRFAHWRLRLRGGGHLVCIAFDIKKVPHLHKTHFLEWVGAAEGAEAAGE